MGFAWTPKATVQAAVGSMILDSAVALKLDEYIGYGVKCLTASILSILITAPMGAILINSLGTKWLTKQPDEKDSQYSGMHADGIYAPTL